MCATNVSARAQFQSIAPYFVVSDVARAAEYYRDQLGFEVGDYFGEPPCFVIVSRDGVELFLRSFPGGLPKPNRAGSREEAWDAYLHVNDLDALCLELKENGARIIRLPSLTDYGVREMEVVDPDGYILCFAEQNRQMVQGWNT